MEHNFFIDFWNCLVNIVGLSLSISPIGTVFFIVAACWVLYWGVRIIFLFIFCDNDLAPHPDSGKRDPGHKKEK